MIFSQNLVLGIQAINLSVQVLRNFKFLVQNHQRWFQPLILNDKITCFCAISYLEWHWCSLDAVSNSQVCLWWGYTFAYLLERSDVCNWWIRNMLNWFSIWVGKSWSSRLLINSTSWSSMWWCSFAPSSKLRHTWPCFDVILQLFSQRLVSTKRYSFTESNSADSSVHFVNRFILHFAL